MRQFYGSEDQQSETFAAWLRCQPGIKFTHIPNETWTPSVKQKARMHKMGVERGLLDYLIIIPKFYQVHAQSVQLWVEMKKDAKSRVTPEQREWINTLNMLDNVQAEVAHGFDEAVAIVAKQLRNPIMPN